MGRNSINTVNWWATLRIYRVLCQSGLINNNWGRNKEINVRGGRADQTECCLTKLQLLTDHDRMGGRGGGGRDKYEKRDYRG